MLLDQKIVGVTGGGRGTGRLRIWLTVGLLAFLPAISLADGISEVLNWWKDDYDRSA